MWKGYLCFLAVILVGEVVFHLFFLLVGRTVLDLKKLKGREVFKGVLERSVLSIGIAHNVMAIIIAFGALKVATKLSITVTDQNRIDVEKHNDYFVIGNVLSLLFAITYALIAVQMRFIGFRL